MARIINSSRRRKKSRWGLRLPRSLRSLQPLILPLILLTSALALSGYIIVKGIPEVTPEPDTGIPVILSVSPAFGSVGTRVTLRGKFFEEGSLVVFGTDNEMPGFIVPDDINRNGEKLKFTVPENLNLCPPDAEENGTPCPPVTPEVRADSYTIMVQNSQGVSSEARFTVTGE